MSVAQSDTIEGCGGGEELAKGRIAVISGGIMSRVTRRNVSTSARKTLSFRRTMNIRD
jgi:hypothetical protein